MTVTAHTPLLRMVWPDEDADIDLEPLQGLWSVEQYLALTAHTNRLIEFTRSQILDGFGVSVDEVFDAQ